MVLALGNPLMGDDGIGLVALARLQEEWEVPPEIELEDGGTWGMRLLPVIDDAERLILVDAINLGVAQRTLVVLERTLEVLGEELGIAVVTGDVQTQNDADRLARRTERLVQAVVTGGACHLDARQIQESLEAIELARTRLLFVENVGNLVCPASWDVGETAKVVLISVTEGEDKPLKYPKMFRMARFAVLNKIDLLPYLDFDVELAIRYARQINPELRFFLTSARTGEGLDEWFDFLREQVQAPAGV